MNKRMELTENNKTLIGYTDDKGRLVTIGYRPGFAKRVGYSDGGFIDDSNRAIPNSWKPVYAKKTK